MKGINKNRTGNVGRTSPWKQQSPRRPWALMALGVVGFAAVIIIGVDRAHRSDSVANPAQKVYSAAAEAFETMAVSSNQTGKLEPPGVVSPLRLFAVRPGGSSRQGIAVLGADEASSRTYVAGALFENGARLTELYADHVVLVRGGKNYKLYLPDKGRSDLLAKPDTPGLTIGGFSPAQPPPATPPIRVSDAVRVAPVYEGTQIAGYSVYAGSRATQFERWGFKAGDVLVSLGGQPLTTSEQMESLLDQLAQGGTLTGEVRRGEERVTVTLDGNALLAAAPVRTELGSPPLP